MSGICGIIHFDGRPVEQGLIENMTSAMAYRGSDAIAHWVKGPVALGHCLLQTTPESLEERQPLANEKETLVLVMDGRVDNWEELRQELLAQGVLLRDRSDAELVLRAYETWERNFLQHIDGDFALVIWDVRQQKAVCARDRMGNKPFNYHWDGKTLAFASELHPLLTLPGMTQTLNEGVLVEFLAAEWYSRDETFWKEIKRLIAAHVMEVSQDGVCLEEYWQPDYWQTFPFKTDEEYVEHYLELFSEAVRRMSRSHQPVAYEVSGGLDSSAIFCMADVLQRTQHLPAPRIEGYTLAFSDDKCANELVYSRAVGEHLGVEIHEVPPTLVPLTWYQDWAHQHQEYPGAPHGVMSLDLRQRAIERGSRVIVSGSGGDEWTSGQRLYYAEELAARRWRESYTCLKADIHDYNIPTGLRWFLRYGVFPLLSPSIQESLFALRHQLPRSVSDTRVQSGVWLTADLQKILEQRRKRSNERPAPPLRSPGQYSQRALLLDPYIALAGEMEDRTCSGSGLEYRRPMRSPKLVQYAFATPERLRLRGRTNKYMHRQAMRQILPEIVRQREGKAEFSVVFRKYLDSYETELRQNIPDRRKEWVLSNRINLVYDYYLDRIANSGFPSGGKSQSILWNLLVCDLLLKGKAAVSR